MQSYFSKSSSHSSGYSFFIKKRGENVRKRFLVPLIVFFSLAVFLMPSLFLLVLIRLLLVLLIMSMAHVLIRMNYTLIMNLMKHRKKPYTFMNLIRHRIMVLKLK